MTTALYPTGSLSLSGSSAEMKRFIFEECSSYLQDVEIGQYGHEEDLASGTQQYKDL